jgi:hypothetical protein
MSESFNPNSLVALHVRLMGIYQEIHAIQNRVQAACRAGCIPNITDVSYQEGLRQCTEDLRERIKSRLTEAEWVSVNALQICLQGNNWMIEEIQVSLNAAHQKISQNPDSFSKFCNLARHQEHLRQCAEDLREQIESQLTEAEPEGLGSSDEAQSADDSPNSDCPDWYW